MSGRRRSNPSNTQPSTPEQADEQTGVGGEIRKSAITEENHMITLEEAIEIAREYRPNIDNGYENKKAYIFSSHEDEGKMGSQPVVVLKETGEVMLMPMYVASGKSRNSGDAIREFKF